MDLPSIQSGGAPQNESQGVRAGITLNTKENFHIVKVTKTVALFIRSYKAQEATLADPNWTTTTMTSTTFRQV